LAGLGTEQGLPADLNLLVSEFYPKSGIFGKCEEVQTRISSELKYLGVNINTALQRICPAEYLVTKMIVTGSPQNLPQLTTPKAFFEDHQTAQLCCRICSAGMSISFPDSVLADQQLESSPQEYNNI
jgi:hypothetical protein